MTKLLLSTETVVQRLRWVMLLVILIDTACTILGQPPGYWHDPRQATEIEPIVRFLLVRGIASFAIGAVLYVAGAFCLVSLAPPRLGLAVLFAFLLAHFWGATSWLLYHFHWGVRCQNLFEVGIAVLIALALGRERKESTA